MWTNSLLRQRVSTPKLTTLRELQQNDPAFSGTLFESTDHVIQLVITKLGGAMWFGEFLINHHGESTVFDDAPRLHRMVNDTLIANKYKYERLLATIEFEYSLNAPIERKVTEVHSGSDTTTIDTDTATHRSGTDTTTDRYAQRDNRQYTTTEDSTTEYLNTHNQSDAVTDVNEAAYNSGQTGHTDGTNTLAHGHNIETIYSFHREPQTEIQAERLIAEFSLHMTIINDVLDAIALPVYLF